MRKRIIIDVLYWHPDVDTVHDWSRELSRIAVDVGGFADAALQFASHIATWARVHGGNECARCREMLTHGVNGLNEHPEPGRRGDIRRLQGFEDIL